MAAYTSKASGDLSAGGQTTWNEAGTPGTGDSFEVADGHVITLDTGCSGWTVTLTAAGNTGYFTITTGTVSLTCAPSYGGTGTTNGLIYMTGGTLTLTGVTASAAGYCVVQTGGTLTVNGTVTNSSTGRGINASSTSVLNISAGASACISNTGTGRGVSFASSGSLTVTSNAGVTAISQTTAAGQALNFTGTNATNTITGNVNCTYLSGYAVNWGGTGGLTLNGNVRGGANAAGNAWGLYVAAAATITINGDTAGAAVANNNSAVDERNVLNLASGTPTVTINAGAGQSAIASTTSGTTGCVVHASGSLTVNGVSGQAAVSNTQAGYAIVKSSSATLVVSNTAVGGGLCCTNSGSGRCISESGTGALTITGIAGADAITNTGSAGGYCIYEVTTGIVSITGNISISSSVTSPALYLGGTNASNVWNGAASNAATGHTAIRNAGTLTWTPNTPTSGTAHLTTTAVPSLTTYYGSVLYQGTGTLVVNGSMLTSSTKGTVPLIVLGGTFTWQGTATIGAGEEVYIQLGEIAATTLNLGTVGTPLTVNNSGTLAISASAGCTVNHDYCTINNVTSGAQSAIIGHAVTVTGPTLPAANKVKTGEATFGYSGDPQTPSFSPDFPAVAAVLDSDTVDGAAGTYHAPEAAEVISTAVFGPASGTAGTYDVANVAAGNIKKDIGIGGVTGTLYGDTDASKVLTTATKAGTYDATNLSVGNVIQDVTFGVSSTGTGANLLATHTAYVTLEESRNNDNGTVAADIVTGKSVKIRNVTTNGSATLGGGGGGNSVIGSGIIKALAA